MFKKNILLTAVLLVASGFAAQAADSEKLYDAVKRSDVAEFKKHFKRVQPLSRKEKKDLLDEAQDVVDERESRASFFKSGWDISKAVGGTALGAIGAFAVYVGFRVRDLQGYCTMAVGGAAGTFGLYKAFRGITCQTAKGRLNAALAIEKAIEKAELAGGEKELCEKA